MLTRPLTRALNTSRHSLTSIRMSSTASFVALSPDGKPANASGASTALSHSLEALWKVSNTNNKPGVTVSHQH